MSELLQPRDPRINPRSSDRVAIGDTQYEVLTREGTSLTVERLERGRRRTTGMPLEGWRTKMRDAVIVSVSGQGALGT